jgi:hypothetical protein
MLGNHTTRRWSRPHIKKNRQPAVQGKANYRPDAQPSFRLEMEMIGPAARRVNNGEDDKECVLRSSATLVDRHSRQGL